MKCVRCGGYGELARGRTSVGQWQVFYFCFDCGRRTSTHNFSPNDVQLDELPIAWDRAGENRRPCAKCGAVADVELHHFGPRHLFGDEADEWPTAFLCTDCHRRWHNVVTPLMSFPQAATEIITALPADSPVAKALRKAEVERLKSSARGKDGAA